MLGWLLGGVYSVPPIRTKRNPIAAGLTIATVRGFLLNFGVYYAVKDAIGAPFSWSPKVSFIARFMTAFATVIAVTKDLPDVEGDKVRKLWCIHLFIFGCILSLIAQCNMNRNTTFLHSRLRLECLRLLKEQPCVYYLTTSMLFLLACCPKQGRLGQYR